RFSRDWSSDVCSSDLKMKFDSCYIDTDELIIKTNSSESYCTIIRIVFDKNSVIPTGLQGCIDFSNNKTSGDFGLLLLGAEAVERSEERRVGKECGCVW